MTCHQYSHKYLFMHVCRSINTPYFHLATSEMWCWSEERGILKKKLYLCYSIVYCYNGAQWYEQFSHVGRLYDWALILIGLALFSERLCVFGLRGGLYI